MSPEIRTQHSVSKLRITNHHNHFLCGQQPTNPSHPTLAMVYQQLSPSLHVHPIISLNHTLHPHTQVHTHTYTGTHTYIHWYTDIHCLHFCFVDFLASKAPRSSILDIFNSPLRVDFKTKKIVIIWCNFDQDISKILKGSHCTNQHFLFITESRT